MTHARALVLLSLLSAACGSTSTPTAPSTPSMQAQSLNASGTWTGTYASAQVGYGKATLSLAQSGTAISGTWSTTPDPGGGSGVGGGTITGVNPLTGNSGVFTLMLIPSDPRTCGFQSTMTIFLAQRQMTGE
jgi:hypothetical protein